MARKKGGKDMEWAYDRVSDGIYFSQKDKRDIKESEAVRRISTTVCKNITYPIVLATSEMIVSVLEKSLDNRK